MKRLFSTILLLSALGLFTSCKHLELNKPTSGVFVRLTLSQGPSDTLPDEFINSSNSEIQNKIKGHYPEKVRLLFYDPDTHELVEEDYINPEGGFVDVPSGYYDIVAYGMGSNTTRVSGIDSRAGSYAYTSGLGATLRMTKSDDPDGYIDFPIIYEPDPIYVGRAENTYIPVRAEQDRTLLIDLFMPTLLDTYSFEIPEIEGAQYIKSAEIYITGQAAFRYLWDKRLSNKNVALYFKAPVNKEDGSIKTVFSTFGSHSPQIQNDVYLNIMVTDANGARFQWIYNVTEQFNNPDNNNHRIVIGDHIIIPNGVDGGINPDVNDWEAEITTIPL